MVTMDTISTVLISTYGDRGLIFKVTVGHHVGKYCIVHLVSMIFPKLKFRYILSSDHG